MRKKIIFLIWLFCFFFCNIAYPSEIKIKKHLVLDVVPLNLREITGKAEKIFSGKCIKIEQIEKDSLSKLPVVKYTFQIQDGIKGVKNKKEIVIKQWRDLALKGDYKEGGKYFLFLYPDSEIGLTSPVGFLQGRFEIQKRKIILGVKEVVVNGFSNKGLYKNLRTKQLARIDGNSSLNNYLQKVSENAEAMDYKEFIKTIKYFLKQ